MNIELRWDNDEHTTVYCHLKRGWQWSELFQTMNTVREWTENSDPRVAAIIEIDSDIGVPGDSIFLPDNVDQARKLLKMGEGGTGLIMVVGVNSFVRMIFDCLQNLNRRATWGVRFIDSIEAARDYILRAKNSLDEFVS